MSVPVTTSHLRLHPATDDGAAATSAALARELAENLDALRDLLKQLLDLSGDKLAAIRGADHAALQRCAAREGGLLEEVRRVEQQRAAILARAAQHLLLPPSATQRVGALADHFPAPGATLLRAKNAALRQVAAQLQQKNSLVAAVAQNLQTHLRAIFADVARAAQETVVYGPKGQPEARNTRSWVDAVG